MTIIHLDFVICFSSEDCGSYILCWLITPFLPFFLPPYRKDTDDSLHFNRGSQKECAIIVQKYFCWWSSMFLLCWELDCFIWNQPPPPPKNPVQNKKMNEGQKEWTLLGGLHLPVQMPSLPCSATHSDKLTSKDCITSGFCWFQPIGTGRPISEGGRRALFCFVCLFVFWQPLLSSYYVPSSKFMTSLEWLFSLCDRSLWVHITAPSLSLQQWLLSSLLHVLDVGYPHSSLNIINIFKNSLFITFSYLPFWVWRLFPTQTGTPKF